MCAYELRASTVRIGIRILEQVGGEGRDRARQCLRLRAVLLIERLNIPSNRSGLNMDL